MTVTFKFEFLANGGKPDRRRKLEMATLIFPQRKNNTGLLNYRIGRKKIMIDRKKQGLSEKISMKKIQFLLWLDLILLNVC